MHIYNKHNFFHEKKCLHGNTNRIHSQQQKYLSFPIQKLVWLTQNHHNYWERIILRIKSTISLVSEEENNDEMT